VREKKLLFRWSILTSMLFTLCWAMYSWMYGPVPVFTSITIMEKTFTLPIGISRWWDVLATPVWIGAFICIGYLKREGEWDDLMAGLKCGLVFSLFFNLHACMGVGLLSGLLIGRLGQSGENKERSKGEDAVFPEFLLITMLGMLTGILTIIAGATLASIGLALIAYEPSKYLTEAGVGLLFGLGFGLVLGAMCYREGVSSREWRSHLSLCLYLSLFSGLGFGLGFGLVPGLGFALFTGLTLIPAFLIAAAIIIVVVIVYWAFVILSNEQFWGKVYKWLTIPEE
jgi:hypothetical protein